MKDPLLRPVLAVLLGGWLAGWIQGEVRSWVLAFFLLFLFALWRFWRPGDFYGRVLRPEVLLLACSLGIGLLFGMIGDRSLAGPVQISQIELKGTLQDWRRLESHGQGILALEDGKRYSLRVYADHKGEVPKGWDQVKPGDLIRFNGRLEQPEGPGTRGAFHQPLYLAVRNLEGYLTGRGEVLLLREGTPGWDWQFKEHLRGIVETHWPEGAGVWEGILFGDDSGIEAETLERYRVTGVLHVFAASGANVAFVIALVWILFFFVPKPARIALAILAILFYAVLCQGNPPILRATILGTAVLLSKLGHGRLASLRWLGITALLLFLYNPLYVRDSSFQLSFAATWGMLVLAPRLLQYPLLRRLPVPLQTASAITLGAQLATLPILISSFHQVSLVGLIANVFVLFLLGAVLQLGLLGALFSFLPSVPLIFFQGCFWLLAVADLALSALASLPFASTWVLNPGILFWFVWYLGLFLWIGGKERAEFVFLAQLKRLEGILPPFLRQIPIRPKQANHPNQPKEPTHRHRSPMSRQRWLSFLPLLLLGILLFAPNWQKDHLALTFLDVGQGDSILIETGTERLLVDTGPKKPNYDAGERILIPYLLEEGIGSLDLVLITHEDLDHLGGAKSLLETIPTGKVGLPELGGALQGEAWRNSLPTAFRSPERQLRLKAGDRITYPSGLQLEVLGPVTLPSGEEYDSNAFSLVLLLHYQGKKILLTGDLDLEGMEELADRGVDWDADFIKLPHHGSAGSLDPGFFDQTSPEAVFIPVGRNTFGHPTPQVLAYWQERGVPVYRTDVHGSIRLVVAEEGSSIQPGRNP